MNELPEIFHRIVLCVAAFFIGYLCSTLIHFYEEQNERRKRWDEEDRKLQESIDEKRK